MGVTVVDSHRGDIDSVIRALREALMEALAAKNVKIEVPML
jgi:hypothetical protein